MKLDYRLLSRPYDSIAIICILIALILDFVDFLIRDIDRRNQAQAHSETFYVNKLSHTNRY